MDSYGQLWNYVLLPQNIDYSKYIFYQQVLIERQTDRPKTIQKIKFDPLRKKKLPCIQQKKKC